jgi:hypothetical protein
MKEIILLDASEILPRLWIGTSASCEAARELGFFRLNVLEGAHAGGCRHNRILGDDGKVERGRLEEAIVMINREWPHHSGVLVHCGAGVERSPLVAIGGIWRNITSGGKREDEMRKLMLALAAVLALTSISATGAERYQPNEASPIVPPAEYDKPFVGGTLEEFIINDLAVC